MTFLYNSPTWIFKTPLNKFHIFRNGSQWIRKRKNRNIIAYFYKALSFWMHLICLSNIINCKRFFLRWSVRCWYIEHQPAFVNERLSSESLSENQLLTIMIKGLNQLSLLNHAFSGHLARELLRLLHACNFYHYLCSFWEPEPVC